MSNWDDHNWGPHGNPNREDWYQTPRQLKRSLYDDQEKSDLKVSLWTLFCIFAVILFFTAISETGRHIIFEGGSLAQAWYDGVDRILDALGAPKLP